MAIRHIREYFNQVADNYLQMQQEIKEFEEESQKGLCDPDRVEVLKKLAEPIKDNYMTLSYVMYLLNMPNRDSKKKKYEMMNEKFLRTISHENTKEGILETNQRCLENIKEV